jgi:hypothetical protein
VFLKKKILNISIKNVSQIDSSLNRPIMHKKIYMMRSAERNKAPQTTPHDLLLRAHKARALTRWP